MTESKYKQIANELLAEISAGKYQPSGRLPSEAQLVERFKVARPTAARALRDLQDQGLIERRAGSGSYVRNTRAPIDSTRQLGLLVPNLAGTEILEVICGNLARLARIHDYGLIWGSRDSVGDSVASVGDAVASAGDAETIAIKEADSLCQQYIDCDVRGVFFAPIEHNDRKDELNLRLAERLHQAGISVILLDRDLSGFANRSEFDLVGIDNFAAGYTIADHLLKLGCKRLSFLSEPLSAPTASVRIAGVREAIRVHGCNIAKNFVHECVADDENFVKMLQGKRDTDAILCASDRVAATLMQSMTKAGVSVPHDLRIVGFDDVKYASLLSVPLTTMRQPCREIAAVAFRAMLDSIEERDIPPRSYVLPARLVVRESCGAYLARR
ncbi:MAG: GntR family transcriptional regulator [Phycisphaera sp. RhM]|nr:GntR family transcriptional regulator [Phycisphaera sp. RhM]